jgi:hypothetical protein
MTATAEQLDVLRESLTAFNPQPKFEQEAKEDEDLEYIEEIFEDDAEQEDSIIELSEAEMLRQHELDQKNAMK